MKTFFEKWQNRDHGYTNLGGFQELIMKAYQHGDLENRQRLEIAYPKWFLPDGGRTAFNEDVAIIQELVKVVADPTYGDLVWRLMIKEKAEKIVDKIIYPAGSIYSAKNQKNKL